MVFNSYDEYFHRATGQQCYPYQRQLATAPEWPALLHVPTGAGKTAAVILGWLWRRLFGSEELRAKTPRRLVYCLPMRVLVEQTRQRAEEYLQRLGIAAEELPAPNRVSLHVVMGGEADDDWALYPEQEAIIIGTQDMLLSRALNRGYGASRFRWPSLYGILHNDSLWVLDEIQLMGTGLATSAQLEAFRQTLGTFGSAQTLWMSATAAPHWLATVDHPAPGPERILTLGSADQVGALKRRLTAVKILRESQVNWQSKVEKYSKELARELLTAHRPGSLSLAILNTVERATQVYCALTDLTRKEKNAPEVLLVHSRFRPVEREALNRALSAPVMEEGSGRIVVSTQVVEAGVDLSARVLFTELAPWPSLVQRFGRANRRGEYEEAQVFWINLPEKAADPYSREELAVARALLQRLQGQSVAPANLPSVGLNYEPEFILRRRDIIELFDTTPDLSGNDLDISRFIRNTSETDVEVFWREIEGETPPSDLPRPRREELCAVPLWSLKEMAKKKPVWRWDHLDGVWRRVTNDRIFPGQVFLLAATSGGYSSTLGWFPESTEPVRVVPPVPEDLPEEDVTDDRQSFATRSWYLLSEHSNDVVAEMKAITAALSTVLPSSLWNRLEMAARWHDVGKAHPIFQETMLRGLTEEEKQTKAQGVWAKKAGAPARHRRPHFRHELASALAALTHLRDNLVAYLVATHHGKIRLAIRSYPGEIQPAGGEHRFASGIWDGDVLPKVDLGGGVILPATTLDLSLMEIGLGSKAGQEEPSWIERTLSLRDNPEFGPFRLAYLEAVLIAADRRASAKERG